MTTATTPSAYDRPDWGTITHEVFCPLCDYNLRTLTEPRCPECGYQFQWPDLLDPARRDHPYVFEHHRSHVLRSFGQTAWHGLRPMRFWKTLRPEQRSVPRRLMLYALIVALAVLVAVMSELSLRTLRWYLYSYSPWTGGIRWSGFERLLGESSPPFCIEAAVLVAWPWLTYWSLMIFQISMRRAKVKRNHVLRCVVYSADIFLWLALIHLLLNAARAGSAMAAGNHPYVERGPDQASVLIWLCVWPVFIYRLIVAYTHYLRFRHVVATILVAQLLVFLFVVTVLTVRAVY